MTLNLFVRVCISMYEDIHMDMDMYVHVWKKNVKAGCLPQLLSTLICLLMNLYGICVYMYMYIYVCRGQRLILNEFLNHSLL